MMPLLVLIAGGLYLGHRQAQKRAGLDSLGAKAPDNLLAPTDSQISDDNTGMPTPVKADGDGVPPSVPLNPAAANPAVAVANQSFTGEAVSLYFAPAKEDASFAGNEYGPGKREESDSVKEKTAEREEWLRQRGA